VVCCELIEHLAYSPAHMLYEINKSLRDSGLLFITTPNAVSMQTTVRAILNRPIYHGYAGNGIYGRHNREWTMSELILQLSASGFTPVSKRWVNCYFHKYDPNWRKQPLKGWLAQTIYNFLTRWPVPYLASKRHLLMVVARKCSPAKKAYPPELYAWRELY
jgi:2-polyprenyl-3-methyl-5-hydroxy-6-metoxy-1,4-benzoquinol methylase